MLQSVHRGRRNVLSGEGLWHNTVVLGCNYQGGETSTLQNDAVYRLQQTENTIIQCS